MGGQRASFPRSEDCDAGRGDQSAMAGQFAGDSLIYINI